MLARGQYRGSGGDVLPEIGSPTLTFRERHLLHATELREATSAPRSRPLDLLVEARWAVWAGGSSNWVCSTEQDIWLWTRGYFSPAFEVFGAS